MKTNNSNKKKQGIRFGADLAETRSVGRSDQSSGNCSLMFEIKVHVAVSNRLKNLPAMGNISCEI